MIDSHAHIYATEFDADRDKVIQTAKQRGITKILLPNIDRESIPGINTLLQTYPDFCYKMMGLHPCSVKDNYHKELQEIKTELYRGDSIAVGEIGIDLYWDRSTQKIQMDAFLEQCQWAIDLDLPIVIHSRESIDLIIDLIETHFKHKIRGVFHCFTGDLKQAERIVQLNMYLGIGGVLTFKNSNLKNVLKGVNPENLLIETDAPYLAPVPHRGKRNEPAFIELVLNELTEIYQQNKEVLARLIESNTLTLFKI